MASLDDLSKMLEDRPDVREDFVSTLLGFFQRHGIEVNANDIKGFQVSEEARGYLSALEGGVPGALGAGLVPQARTISPGSVSVVIYRDGSSTSRWIWV